jgi:hypothetical protein
MQSWTILKQKAVTQFQEVFDSAEWGFNVLDTLESHEALKLPTC